MRWHKLLRLLQVVNMLFVFPSQTQASHTEAFEIGTLARDAIINSII